MRKMGDHRLIGLLAALALLAGFLAGGLQPAAQAAPAPEAAAWQLFPTPAAGVMYSVDMIDAGEGWAGGIAGFMMHYSGGNWTSVQTDFDSPVQGIDMLSAGSGWGVTYHGHFLRYNGSSWSVHSRPGGENNSASLEDIYMVSETEGWAVGGPVNACYPTTPPCLQASIYRYNSGSNSWVRVPSPVPSWLFGIDMLGSGDGFIVGVGGSVLRWNGSAWSGGSIASGLALLDVDAISGTDVWAVGYEAATGDGVLYHWNGSAWTRTASPNGAKLNAVQMLSSRSGWAMGDQGTILHYDGSSWQVVASPTTEIINTFDMVGCAEGWAFARGAQILHLSGAPVDLSPSQKRVSPVYAAWGNRLTYTITVRNGGDCDAEGVSLSDAVPAKTTYVSNSATITQGTGTIQQPGGGQPLRVQWGTIAGQGVAEITFQVDLDGTGPACWIVPNQAVISWGTSQWTRLAGTTVGDCHQSFLPALFRAW